MYEENDYIMRQIKSMVEGLGKFMGLQQIKELLQIDEVQQESMTDEELETIIAVSKIELIMANRTMSGFELTNELNIATERVIKLVNNETIATQEELKQLNVFIDQNQQYL